MPAPIETVRTLVTDIQRAVNDCKHFKTQSTYLLHQCQSILTRSENLGLDNDRAAKLTVILKNVCGFVKKLATSGLVLQFFQKSEIKANFEQFKRELSDWDHHREMSIPVNQAQVEDEDKAFDAKKAQVVKHQDTATKLYKGNRVKVDLEKFAVDASRVHKGESLGFFTFGEVFAGTVGNGDKQISVHIKQLRDQIDPTHKEAIKRGILINRYLQECDNIVRLLYLSGSNMILMEATTYAGIHNLPATVVLDNTAKLAIARKVAAALSYIHACGIIHRDVRGNNVQLSLTENGTYEPKLGGFESCRDLASLSLIHTPPTVWDAPERVRYGTSTSTDIYAFGVVLWEISQRREPDPNSNISSLLGEEYGNISKDYSDLMKRCLSDKTEDRPTMKDIALELASMDSDAREE
ncbi:hypothetical protein DFQ27_008894 [Actinomortierella ambigua]|uniref:Protein kinase domain-containing protein n=1 Tax=Actinomortierella ambigua TaxID=1343610 RepID=A0A9P6TY78_9FUNG|nr:hypothetical protein DFQ27_008894 [Actinomortierella ambigua]